MKTLRKYSSSDVMGRLVRFRTMRGFELGQALVVTDGGATLVVLTGMGSSNVHLRVQDEGSDWEWARN